MPSKPATTVSWKASADLNITDVSDDGLAHLSELTKLKTLMLADTFVTDEGFGKLKETLPDCEISK